jgi:hypothetical protein
MADDGHKLTALMLSLGALKRGKGELEVFDGLEYCDDKAEGLLAKAINEGQEPDAFRAACILASRLLLRGKKLPARLAAFAALALGELGLAKPRRGQGRHDGYANAWKHLLVIGDVKAACLVHNVKPTRNAATDKRESGCSIVAEKRGMEQGAVVKIWGKRKQYGIRYP